MTDIEKLIAGPSKEAYGSDVEELLLEAAAAAVKGEQDERI